MEQRHKNKRYVCFICDKGYVMEHWWIFHINNAHNGVLSVNDYIDRTIETRWKLIKEANLKKIVKPSSQIKRFENIPDSKDKRFDRGV
jgi:hypothetical protein